MYFSSVQIVDFVCECVCAANVTVCDSNCHTSCTHAKAKLS